ncbi:EAL domain, c-di-GMP-specific phosphodiesterase class I (or its enzymatically inactive variant) [Thiocapsa roseopersicina]|uniref:EAL domain, c-di-GMP-specific phosphodiesterase class I (Or its enzymatically inactive variant) n=2 Tax=Thiocapsa roseopersicina TaxID=1058 RepID=A0A1H2R4M5_THIRO|nr:EAL domain, c-di-GMP-specific phosphodiesterase class I (or its enzymatically inactive variant) [Thiocapsa roseopersicina]
MELGLRRGEFFLEYLPTISLADGRCTGAEALIRWRRPDNVTIPPGDFIPIAENTRVSGILTYWVIETVAVELMTWLQANPDAKLAINIPPEIVGRGGIRYAADRSGLSDFTDQLIMEMTERGIPDMMAVTAINDYLATGGCVALDDVTLVGGGNLAVLARCHISIIKLDRSLVSQIAEQDPAPAWLESVTALLRSSQLKVVAEGVETEFQLAALRAAGIQEAQGFYFSRPIPAAEFVAFHHKTRGYESSSSLQSDLDDGFSIA